MLLQVPRCRGRVHQWPVNSQKIHKQSSHTPDSSIKHFVVDKRDACRARWVQNMAITNGWLYSRFNLFLQRYLHKVAKAQFTQATKGLCGKWFRVFCGHGQWSITNCWPWPKEIHIAFQFDEYKRKKESNVGFAQPQDMVYIVKQM
jgi:hypothetical protein